MPGNPHCRDDVARQGKVGNQAPTHTLDSFAVTGIGLPEYQLVDHPHAADSAV